jgi:hypothetical protein
MLNCQSKDEHSKHDETGHGGDNERASARLGGIAGRENACRFKIFDAKGCRFTIIVGRNEFLVQQRVGYFYYLAEPLGTHGTYRASIE